MEVEQAKETSLRPTLTIAFPQVKQGDHLQRHNRTKSK